MTLIDIADQIYNNSNQISFGTNENWNNEVFTARWFSNLGQPPPNAPGLYWFLTDSEITNVERPISLPRKGCDFGMTARTNLQTFTTSLLTSIDTNGLKVIYNGHEKNVMNRVRQHFSLSSTNHNTGALGINHYNHSDKNWVLKYFTITDIHNLLIDNLNQVVILNLLNSKTGRTALENTWRIKNGWPILCKE